MALGKGIPVINGFDLNSKLPLDSRAVVDTMEEMNKLVTGGSVGDGQLCYCKADKKLYVLKDNVWSEVGGGGGKEIKIISITEILDTKYVYEIYGYLTDSGASVGKKYPLLKDITDIIDNYDTIFITTNAVGLEGGLLFRKQLNGLPTTFSLTYGYFSFFVGDPGVDVIDFSTICVSLTNDTFWLGTISSGHLLPKYDETMNGKVLSVVDGRARWANAGGGGSSLDIVTINVNEEITDKVYSKVDTSGITSATRFVLVNEKFGANSYTYLLSKMEDSTFGNYYRMPDSLGGVGKGIILDSNGVIKVTALNAVASSSIASLPIDDTTPVIFECNLFTRIGSSIITLNIGGGDEYISLVKSKSPEMFVSPLKQKGSNYVYYYAKVKDVTNMQLYRKTLTLPKLYNHSITLTYTFADNTSIFYLTYQNTLEDNLGTLDSLKTALTGKRLLCTGHTNTKKAEYISVEGANIVVGVVDNSDNSTSGITIDSSFTITDLVSPVR